MYYGFLTSAWALTWLRVQCLVWRREPRRLKFRGQRSNLKQQDRKGHQIIKNTNTHRRTHPARGSDQISHLTCNVVWIVSQGS